MTQRITRKNCFGITLGISHVSYTKECFRIFLRHNFRLECGREILLYLSWLLGRVPCSWEHAVSQSYGGRGRHCHGALALGGGLVNASLQALKSRGEERGPLKRKSSDQRSDWRCPHTCTSHMVSYLHAISYLLCLYLTYMLWAGSLTQWHCAPICSICSICSFGSWTSDPDRSSSPSLKNTILFIFAAHVLSLYS